MCTLQSLSSGTSEQPAQLSAACGDKSYFPKLCMAAGTEQHPFRKAKNGWLAVSCPNSPQSQGRLQQGRQAVCRTCHALQAVACQARRGQVGRAPRSEHTIPRRTQSQACSQLEGAMAAPPPAPHTEKGSQAAPAHSRTFPLPPLHLQREKCRSNTC